MTSILGFSVRGMMSDDVRPSAPTKSAAPMLLSTRCSQVCRRPLSVLMHTMAGQSGRKYGYGYGMTRSRDRMRLATKLDCFVLEPSCDDAH
eukprot:9502559-Pyramimonas_sp.AAC.1